MRLLHILALLITGASIASCAAVETLQPTGGSRADGLVKLSYQYGIFEQPQVDWAQGLRSAQEVCAGWGYSGARRFAGELSTCDYREAAGDCTQTLVTVTYQCTGR